MLTHSQFGATLLVFEYCCHFSAERLKKPTVEFRLFPTKGGQCQVVFWCSTDKGVDFHLEVKALSDTLVINGHGRSDVLSRNLTTTQDLKVTCTSNRNEEKTSSTITLKCAGKVTVD